MKKRFIITVSQSENTACVLVIAQMFSNAALVSNFVYNWETQDQKRQNVNFEKKSFNIMTLIKHVYLSSTDAV